jgi:heptosyltransferase-2
LNGRKDADRYQELVKVPKNILVRGVNWIGDAMMTIPAMRELRRLFPESRITLLIKEPMDQLFRSFSAVDYIIGFSVRQGPRGIWDRLGLVRKLRQTHFDICVILPNSFDSALVPFLARIPERIGFDRDGRGLLLTSRVPAIPKGTDGHQARHYLSLISVLGPTEPDLKLNLEVAQDALDWAETRLAGLKKEVPGPLIAINPGAAYGPAKMWFPERFAELGSRLSAHLGAGIVIVGSPGERQLCGSIAAETKAKVLDLSGETDLQQLAATLSLSDLLVTNDSGPMHLASAVGLPVVAIFGSTNPGATSPMGENKIVQKSCECAPCLERICPRGDTFCMDLVQVDDVLESTKDLLRERERITS